MRESVQPSRVRFQGPSLLDADSVLGIMDGDQGGLSGGTHRRLIAGVEFDDGWYKFSALMRPHVLLRA